MFKTQLFKLIEQADAVKCDDYEIALFGVTGGVYELAYDDDIYWEFKDQEVAVINGSCIAETEPRGPHNLTDKVHLEFFVTRLIEEGDL